MFKKSNQAFTLVEIMIYSAILVVVSTLLISILTVVTRIAGTENASSEIVNQGNFIIQTIQRLVRESSSLEVSSDFKTLSIYLPSYTINPVRIVFDSINKKLNLTDASGVSVLNTSKISIDSLVFKKLSNAGALDIVGVDLILSFNSSKPDQALTRTLSTAISRANAAQFDTGVFPSVDNSLDLGAINQRWKNGLLSGNLTIGGSVGVGGAAAPSSPIKFEINGGIMINTNISKPTCGAAYRGMFWVTQGAAGVKDDVSVCAKDAANAYSWRVIY